MPEWKPFGKLLLDLVDWDAASGVQLFKAFVDSVRHFTFFVLPDRTTQVDVIAHIFRIGRCPVHRNRPRVFIIYTILLTVRLRFN